MPKQREPFGTDREYQGNEDQDDSTEREYQGEQPQPGSQDRRDQEQERKVPEREQGGDGSEQVGIA